MQGNLIGTDSTGKYAIGNGTGIQAGDATIGGTTDEARNIISGNGYGVFVRGGSVIRGNYIGTDINGTAAIGNGEHGVFVFNAWAQPSGAHARPGNVITASASADVRIAGSTGVVVQGNYIGLDNTGNRTLSYFPYLFGGEILVDAQVTNLHIGGTTATAGNVIGGSGVGIAIAGVTTSGVVVEGNSIGLGADGVTPVPNNTGVWLSGGTSNNTIGGTAEGAGNIIANNLNVGVALDQYHVAPVTTGNAILGNSIYNNGTGDKGAVSLGIDIAQPSVEGVDGPNATIRAMSTSATTTRRTIPN